MRLLRTVELFHHKPAIMKKAEGRLEQLRTSLAGFLSENPGWCDPQADRKKGQIVRGENLKGFPFISLDMPQGFRKDWFFTFRTLFWWGHYLGFSFILRGGNLPRYLDTLVQNLEQPEAEGTWIATTDTPWEWELDSGGYQPIRERGRDVLRRHAESRGFLKLLRVHPVAAPAFPHLDWTSAGVSAYQGLAGLFLGD